MQLKPKLTVTANRGIYLLEIMATQAKVSCFIFESTISGIETERWYDGFNSVTRLIKGNGIANFGVLVGKNKKMSFYILISSPRAKPLLVECHGSSSCGSFSKLLTNGDDLVADAVADRLLRSSHDLRHYLSKKNRSQLEVLFFSTANGLVVLSSGDKGETRLVTSTLVKLIKDQERHKQIKSFQAQDLITLLTSNPIVTLVGTKYLDVIRSVTSVSENSAHIEVSRVNVELNIHHTEKRNSLSVRAWMTPPGVERAS
jgi:hypothetical protein